jgi:hypothetical protein
MSAEAQFKDLFSRLETCEDSGERDVLLDALHTLAREVHFSQQEWNCIQARMETILERLYGACTVCRPSAVSEWVN